MTLASSVLYGIVASVSMLTLGMLTWDTRGRKLTSFEYFCFWVIPIGGTWCALHLFYPHMH